MTINDHRRPSRRLTPDDVREIAARLVAGELQSRIAAAFDVNGGRISEINTLQRHAEHVPAHLRAILERRQRGRLH